MKSDENTLELLAMPFWYVDGHLDNPFSLSIQPVFNQE